MNRAESLAVAARPAHENQCIGLGAASLAPGHVPDWKSPERGADDDWMAHMDGDKNRVGWTFTHDARVKSLVLGTDGDPAKIDVWIVLNEREHVHGSNLLDVYLRTAPRFGGMFPLRPLRKGDTITVEFTNRGLAAVVTGGVIVDETPNTDGTPA